MKVIGSEMSISVSIKTDIGLSFADVIPNIMTNHGIEQSSLANSKLR